MKRTQNGDAKMESGGLICDQTRNETRRLTIDARLQRSGTGHSLHQVVESGLVAVRTLARVAQRIGVDEGWIDVFKRVITQAESFDGLRTAVVNEDVGVFHHSLQYLNRFRRLEVETQRTLIAVGGHVDRAHTGVFAERTTGCAQQISARRFNLDDVCTHISEMLRCKRPE